MANTIAEYGYLSTSPILAGIVKTVVNQSPILARAPKRDISGNSLLYNMEPTEAGIQSYVTGDTWVENTTVWAQRNVALTILGGDADVDSFAQQTRSNEQNLEAAIIEMKAKALADKFEKLAILGYTSTTYSAKEFKGLMHLLAECQSSYTTDWEGSIYTNPAAGSNTQVVTGHATSAALALDMMDVLRDQVKPKPDIFLMSRMARNKLQSLARAAGTNLEYIADPRKLGHLITMFGEQEVVISDFIPNNLPDGSSSTVTIRDYAQATTRAGAVDNTVIFAIRWGDADGVAVLSNGGIQTEDIGKLETKDAKRTRIKFYCAMANFGKVSLAGLVNVVPGTEL